MTGKVDRVYCFFFDDAKEGETIPAIDFGDGMATPLLTTKMRIAGMLRRHAQRVANEKRRAVRLVMFYGREEIETFEPEPEK
jgi:hypothetical protein